MSHRRHLLLLAAAVLVCLLALPAASQAACGGVETSHTSVQPAGGGLPPLAIGDSTMLLSLPGLAAEGYDANAHGCREWPEGLALMSQAKAAGQLPHMVVVALGTDCCLSQTDLNDALGILGPNRLLVLVTPKQTGGQTAAASLEHAEAAAHPHRVLLLDWVAYSAGHPDWFQPDGLHLTYPGVAAFNTLLARALPVAQVECDLAMLHGTLDRAQRTLARRARRLSARAARAARARAHAAAAGRITTRISQSARVGGNIVVRTHVAGLTESRPVKVCLTPPGGRIGCHHFTLQPGSASNVLQLPVPRPGGWQVTVTSAPARNVNKIVWVSHPGGGIKLLAAGDSEMQVLDDIISSDLAPYHVSTASKAQQSTGLTNPLLLNWQNEAHTLVSQYHPDVSVVIIGANDGYAINGAGCCGAAWSQGYAGLVSQMATTLLQGNTGRVYWYILPTPRPANFQQVFDGVNNGIRLAAKRFPGRMALVDDNAFFTPGNRYRDYMTVNGHGFSIHESDGIHLNATADQYAAQLLVSAMKRDRVIR